MTTYKHTCPCCKTEYEPKPGTNLFCKEACMLGWYKMIVEQGLMPALTFDRDELVNSKEMDKYATAQLGFNSDLTIEDILFIAQHVEDPKIKAHAHQRLKQMEL